MKSNEMSTVVIMKAEFLVSVFGALSFHCRHLAAPTGQLGFHDGTGVIPA